MKYYNAKIAAKVNFIITDVMEEYNEEEAKKDLKAVFVHDLLVESDSIEIEIQNFEKVEINND